MSVGNVADASMKLEGTQIPMRERKPAMSIAGK